MSDTASDRDEIEHRGEVLDVLRELLTDGRSDDVVSLVSQLVSNNTELAIRAARADELEKRKNSPNPDGMEAAGAEFAQKHLQNLGPDDADKKKKAILGQ